MKSSTSRSAVLFFLFAAGLPVSNGIANCAGLFTETHIPGPKLEMTFDMPQDFGGKARGCVLAPRSPLTSAALVRLIHGMLFVENENGDRDRMLKRYYRCIYGKRHSCSIDEIASFSGHRITLDLALDSLYSNGESDLLSKRSTPIYDAARIVFGGQLDLDKLAHEDELVEGSSLREFNELMYGSSRTSEVSSRKFGELAVNVPGLTSVRWCDDVDTGAPMISFNYYDVEYVTVSRAWHYPNGTSDSHTNVFTHRTPDFYSGDPNLHGFKSELSKPDVPIDYCDFFGMMTVIAVSKTNGTYYVSAKLGLNESGRCQPCDPSTFPHSDTNDDSRAEYDYLMSRSCTGKDAISVPYPVDACWKADESVYDVYAFCVFAFLLIHIAHVVCRIWIMSWRGLGGLLDKADIPWRYRVLDLIGWTFTCIWTLFVFMSGNYLLLLILILPLVWVFVKDRMFFLSRHRFGRRELSTFLVQCSSNHAKVVARLWDVKLAWNWPGLDKTRELPAQYLDLLSGKLEHKMHMRVNCEDGSSDCKDDDMIETLGSLQVKHAHKVYQVTRASMMLKFIAVAFLAASCTLLEVIRAEEANCRTGEITGGKAGHDFPPVGPRTAESGVNSTSRGAAALSATLEFTPAETSSCTQSNVIKDSVVDCDQTGQCSVKGTIQMDMNGGATCVTASSGKEEVMIMFNVTWIGATGQCNSGVVASVVEADGDFQTMHHGNDGDFCQDGYQDPAALSCTPGQESEGGFFPCTEGANVNSLKPPASSTDHEVFLERSKFSYFAGDETCNYGKTKIQRTGQDAVIMTCDNFETEMIMTMDVIKEGKSTQTCIYHGKDGWTTPVAKISATGKVSLTAANIAGSGCDASFSYDGNYDYPDVVTVAQTESSTTFWERDVLQGLSNPFYKATHSLTVIEPSMGVDLLNGTSFREIVPVVFEAATADNSRVYNLDGKDNYHPEEKFLFIDTRDAFYDSDAIYYTCPDVKGGHECVPEGGKRPGELLTGGLTFELLQPDNDLSIFGLRGVALMAMPTGRLTGTLEDKIESEISVVGNLAVDSCEVTGTYGPSSKAEVQIGLTTSGNSHVMCEFTSGSEKNQPLGSCAPAATKTCVLPLQVSWRPREGDKISCRAAGAEFPATCTLADGDIDISYSDNEGGISKKSISSGNADRDPDAYDNIFQGLSAFGNGIASGVSAVGSAIGSTFDDIFDFFVNPLFLVVAGIVIVLCCCFNPTVISARQTFVKSKNRDVMTDGHNMVSPGTYDALSGGLVGFLSAKGRTGNTETVDEAAARMDKAGVASSREMEQMEGDIEEVQISPLISKSKKGLGSRLGGGVGSSFSEELKMGMI